MIRTIGRCLALAAALQNAPDSVLLEQVFAPEADIFCFIFLPVQKPFRFKCDLVYGQDINSGEHWTAAETAALKAAVNRIAEKNVSDGRMIKGRLKSFFWKGE